MKLAVPKVLQKKMLEDMHEGVLGGHLVVEKTMGRFKKLIYLPGHYQDTQNWYKNWVAFLAKKNSTKKPRAPLQSIKIGSPLQKVTTDILGTFPESQGGNNYILVVANYFTRWTEVYPTLIRKS